MAIPEAVPGYGNNSVARNVFAFYTDEDLSSAVLFKAWDNDQSFPTVDTVETVANIVIAGTAGNSNLSMISLVDIESGAPSSDWKPASATGGTANPNRLKGDTSYVTGTVTLSATERDRFNMVIEVPSDVLTTDSMGFDLTVVYTYTGTAPTPVFQYNSGNEGTPVWSPLTVGTHGIKHTRAGVSSPNLYANIPASSTEDTAEGWVTT